MKFMGINWFNKKPDARLSLIPTHIAKLYGRDRIGGPNCWNATIMFFDPQEPVQFVSQERMQSWLKERTYVDVWKRCIPGSILALYDCRGLIHTAVWVAPNLLFHKVGTTGPYEFITPKELFQLYEETSRSEYFLMHGAENP